MDIREVLENNNMSFLMACKGQIQNIEIRVNPDKQRYILADLKIVRPSITDDEYGNGYNRIHVCIPADIVLQLELDEVKLKAMKNNVVYCELSLAARIGQNKNKEGEAFKFNNVRFYANYIEMVKEVQKIGYEAKPVSIAI